MRSRRDDFLAGVRAELPLLAGVAPFGMSYGAYAIDSGFDRGYSQAMSLIVFGGASQFAAVQGFETGLPAAVIVLTIWLVNLRHMLYSAGVAALGEGLSLRWRLGIAYLLTDEGYAAGITSDPGAERPALRRWHLLGACAALWACWQLTTAIGVFAGAAVPESWSLDFAIVVTFIALVVPGMRDRPALGAALAAGAIAALGFRWEYGSGLLAGAVCGIAAGLALDATSGAGAASADGEGP